MSLPVGDGKIFWVIRGYAVVGSGVRAAAASLQAHIPLPVLDVLNVFYVFVVFVSARDLACMNLAFRP